MSIGGLRFAGQLLRHMAPAARASIPHGVRGITADVLPNLLFSGLSAASLPEGTPAWQRAGAAAEDLAFTLPLSWAGRGLGYAGARGVSRAMKRPMGADDMAMVQGLSGGLLEAGAWSSGLLPRPFANAAFDKFHSQMEAQQQEQMALRDAQIREETIRRLGGAGLLMSPMMGAPGGGLG